MALYYECNFGPRNDSANSNTFKPHTCMSGWSCFYCCCNSQCCFVVQRRLPRHLWEAWYFWLGIALLAAFVISSVSSYIISNYRHKIQGIPFRHNSHINGNVRNDRFNRPGINQNQISIIPLTGALPPQRNMLVIAQPGITHMTPVVA